MWLWRRLFRSRTILLLVAILLTAFSTVYVKIMYDNYHKQLRIEGYEATANQLVEQMNHIELVQQQIIDMHKRLSALKDALKPFRKDVNKYKLRSHTHETDTIS